VLSEVCALHKFEVPAGLVHSQVEYLMRENAEYLKRQGFTEKMIRDYFDKNAPELSKRAEEQVRTSLVLDKIAQDQGIKIESMEYFGYRRGIRLGQTPLDRPGAEGR